MALRVHTGKTNKQGLATAVRHAPKRSFEAVARRSIVAGALLAMVLLAMFAVEPPSSGALTVPSVSIPSVSVPSVSVPPVDARGHRPDGLDARGQRSVRLGAVRRVYAIPQL